MSRINDSYEPEDTADILRGYAFEGNMRRALQGKKGQKFLRELEAALLSLPEKKLCEGSLAGFKIQYDPDPEWSSHKEKFMATGQVCALGAVAIARETAKGRKREDVLQALADDEDPDEPEWSKTKETAHYLKICHPLAFAIIERNDECTARNDGERYELVLAWVRRQIKEVK